jgi:hypothetical protein
LIEAIVGVVDWASHKRGGKCEFRCRNLVYFVPGELTSTHAGEYALIVVVRHRFFLSIFGGLLPTAWAKSNLSKQKNMLRKPTEQIFIVQGSKEGIPKLVRKTSGLSPS